MMKDPISTTNKHLRFQFTITIPCFWNKHLYHNTKLCEDRWLWSEQTDPCHDIWK